MKLGPEFCLTPLFFSHIHRWSFQGTWHKPLTSPKKRASSHYCFCCTCPMESRFWTRWVMFNSCTTISHHRNTQIWHVSIIRLSPANSNHWVWGSCWGETALQLVETANAVSITLWKITSSTLSLQTVWISAFHIRKSRPIKCAFLDFVRKRPHIFCSQWMMNVQMMLGRAAQH